MRVAAAGTGSGPGASAAVAGSTSAAKAAGLARPRLRIGTAGWAIPRAVADRFPAEGSGLQRYAGRFNAAEINSTFYRPHRASTYMRWRETTPDGFRFAAKIPKAITHDGRLAGCRPALSAFLEEIGGLEQTLGPLLVQLPPSLVFDASGAASFFADLRSAFDGQVACEPRHPSWFEGPADDLLRANRVARVAADPARAPEAARPGGWPGLAYWRLHGSPRMYYSAYTPDFLERLAAGILRAGADEAWIIFDNTTSGAAAADALALMALVEAGA
jgi:uncharacterized protein YecE (DUF72 family)